MKRSPFVISSVAVAAVVLVSGAAAAGQREQGRRRDHDAQGQSGERAQPRGENRAPRAESRQDSTGPRVEARRDDNARVESRRHDSGREVAVPRAYAPRYDTRVSPRSYAPRYEAPRYFAPRYYAPRYYSRGYYSPRYDSRLYDRPYVFRPRLSIGFGIFAGYPVPYTYAYPYSYIAGRPPASYYGGVALEMSPDDAAVYVDGAYTGIVADFDGRQQPLTLAAGTHRIDVQAPGYAPLLFDVNVQPGQVIPFRGDLQPY